MGTLKRWLWVILVGVVFLLLLWLVVAYQRGTVTTDVTVSELISLAREGRVREIRVEERSFIVLLDDGTRRVGAKGEEDLRHVLQQAGVVDVDMLFRHQ
jgi:archaeosine-15-forming tRNA-guanine transglycosylase